MYKYITNELVIWVKVYILQTYRPYRLIYNKHYKRCELYIMPKAQSAKNIQCFEQQLKTQSRQW